MKLELLWFVGIETVLEMYLKITTFATYVTIYIYPTYICGAWGSVVVKALRY